MNGTGTSADMGDEEPASEIEIVRRAKSKTTKAESVRTQKHLYDKGIEMRIRLQRPMEIAVKAYDTKDGSHPSGSQVGAQVKRGHLSSVNTPGDTTLSSSSFSFLFSKRKQKTNH